MLTRIWSTHKLHSPPIHISDIHLMGLKYLRSTDANECEKKPCQNGGTCTNKFGGYSCSCAAAWTGKNCDQGM